MLSNETLFLILVTTGVAWSYLIPCRFTTPRTNTFYSLVRRLCGPQMSL